MRKIYLREKLKASQPVIGTWCNIPSPIVADIISSSGVDFLIIDREHGPIHFETAQQMIIACEANQTSPVIRIGAPNPEEAQKALDIGAHCIHIPSISTVQQARKCVEIFKYPPLGNRGFSPFTRAGLYGSVPAQEIFDHAMSEPLLAIHIEDLTAVQSIDELLDLDGIDIFFLGLFDLSKALGIPGQITDPELLSLVEQLTLKIRNKGKYPGTIATTKEQLQRYLDCGIQYITYSVDCCILKNSYKEVIHGAWACK